MKNLLIIITLLFTISYLWASDTEQAYQNSISKSLSDLQHCLISKGFENIRFRIGHEKRIIIEYENRCYRYELKALGIVLKYAQQFLTDVEIYIIVPKIRNIPILFIEVNETDYHNFLSGRISSEEFSHKIIITQNFSSKISKFFYKTEQTNNSFLKFDLIVGPGFKIQFSRPQDPAQLQLNFLPSIQTAIAKGLQFQAQMIIPFYNEFQANETRSRLGLTVLNQFIRLPANQFASFSIGYFDFGNKGFSVEYGRYFKNGSILLSSKVDYTTLSSSWNNDYKLHYLVKAKYRFTSVDFSVEACWGHFLFNDDTWRINVLRSFGELDLGFMGTWNHTIGLLTGIILNMPFPPSRQIKPHRIRLTTLNSLPWHYRYLPYYNGFILDTGTDIELFMKKLFPSFIKNNIDDLK